MALYDLIKPHKPFKRYDGHVGLEIETESKSSYIYPPFTFWDVKDDGSLRDFGKEYVLKAPVKMGKELDLALEEFKKKTSEFKFIKDSITTSLHVHLNVLNETIKTIGSFLTAYTLTENLLIRFSGEDRRSNLFCLPICDAEETYKSMQQFLRSAATRNFGGMFLPEGSWKYSALNMSAFTNFGSIEFRSFRGTTDIDEIKSWVNVLYSILEYARRIPDPKAIMNDYKEKGVKILDDIFGEHRGLLSFKEEEALIDKNVFYAASIAYCLPKEVSWDDLDKIPENKPKYTPDQIRRASINKFGKDITALSPGEVEYLYMELQQNLEKTQKKPKSLDWLGSPPTPISEEV